MKRIFLALLMLSITTASFADVKTFSYQKTKARGARVVNEYDLTIEPLDNGHTKFSRTIVSRRYTQDEEFVLDPNYETVQWSTKNEKEETDYSGVLEGRVITLKGMLEGQDISKTIKLEDDRPFYFSPKFNLTKFVLSDDKEIKFWMLRKDKLTEYLMEVTKLGEETITVKGKEVNAIKIRLAATGKGAKYYKRTYFYRKSDGMFLMRKALDGAVTELISK